MDKDLSVAMAVARLRKAKQTRLDLPTEELSQDIASEIIKARKAKLNPEAQENDFSGDEFDLMDDYEMSDAGEVTEDPQEVKRKRLAALFNEPSE